MPSPVRAAEFAAGVQQSSSAPRMHNQQQKFADGVNPTAQDCMMTQQYQNHAAPVMNARAPEQANMGNNLREIDTSKGNATMLA